MPLSAGKSPNPTSILVNEHKNPDFVLEMPENGGPEGQKRTKMSFMCSKIKGLASRRATVAFLQITAHTSEMQIPHNQIINF